MKRLPIAAEIGECTSLLKSAFKTANIHTPATYSASEYVLNTGEGEKKREIRRDSGEPEFSP